MRYNKHNQTRKAIIQYKLNRNPQLKVKGGNSLTNPYKIPYELAVADRLDAMEKYKDSVLWSPRYTPKHFVFLFLYPMGFALILVWYIHYVQMPRRMVHLKKKKGYVFPQLEGQGKLDGWWDYDEDVEEEQYDFKTQQFKKTEDKVYNKQYTDFTLKDLQNFGEKNIFEDSQKSQIEQKSKPIMNMKDKQQLQGALQKIYDLQNKK